MSPLLVSSGLCFLPAPPPEIRTLPGAALGPGGSRPPRLATRERPSRRARELRCRRREFSAADHLRESACRSAPHPDGPGGCAKSLVSHLAPLWHLKGTLLAAEDTGKLQALASWPPSFFPFFFSLLTLADLCVSISPGEAPESIHWAPWDPGTLELGGAVLVVAPRWAEGDMSRASEDSRSRAGGRDSGSLTSRAVSS